LFFWLEIEDSAKPNKRTKSSSLDLFAKKVSISLKDLNLRGYKIPFSIIDYCRASNSGNFYTVIIERLAIRKFQFFFTPTTPK